MNFDAIDWAKYNRPPFLLQWLTKGETKKFAEYYDPLLIDIENEMRVLSDQYDLDTATGILLDRIGKLLDEDRNGNDDDTYRILIRLRAMLNKTNGSEKDIIKVIKYFYNSEVVHIEPNYPAGIRIFHDGEGKPINFNKILKQVVPAGVSYDTQELFSFTDDELLVDSQSVELTHYSEEEFDGKIRHNGRVLRDGHTVRDTELVRHLRNGKTSHNGETKHTSYYRTKATGYIRLPLRRQSGILDPLLMGVIHDYQEQHHSQLFHNGSVARNGEARHNGISPASMSEYMAALALYVLLEDTATMAENSATTVSIFDTDEFTHGYRRNGIQRRNGAIRHSGKIIDTMGIHFSVPVTEHIPGSLYRNGSILRNGSEKHSRLGTKSAYDTASISADLSVREDMPVVDGEHTMSLTNDYQEYFMKHHSRNGHLYRNGTVYRSNFIIDKADCHVTLSPVVESASGRIYRNGSIFRDGSEKHKGYGNRLAYDRFTAGIKYHHYRNGMYKRNGEIQHNTNVLIQV